MHFATFTADTAIEALQRALDELARAGFALEAISLRAQAPRAEVRLEFHPRGGISADTYLARLARMPGVAGVAGGPAAGAQTEEV